jgi:hypothetical protein
MKALRAIIAIVLLVVLYPISVVLSQEVSITIKEIVADQHISGDVRGLTPKEYSNYKVVIYVHTDQWYIHPYAGQDEGKSWATIQENGRWKISTVQREFKADKVAALVVKRSFSEPSRIEDLDKIPRTATIVKELRGTPDHGKL